MAPEKDPAKGGARTLRRLLMSLALLAVAFVGLMVYAYRTPSVGDQLSLGRVYELGSQGKIRFAKLLDEDAVVIGKRCLGRASASSDSTPPTTAVPATPAPPAAPAAADQASPTTVAPVTTSPTTAPPTPAATAKDPCSPPLESFQASYPSSDVATQELIKRLTEGGAQVEVDKQTPTAVIKLLLTFMFPLLVLANLFAIIFLARGGDSTMADIAGFGRMGKGKKRDKEDDRPSTGVTFADVGGADEAVTELREVTDYLKDPSRFEAYGAAAPKGVLLFGPPGCGKTLLARAVAGEAGVPFFAVSGSEFIESLVGVGAARVRDLFRQVKEVAPAIVFIDEIDAVGRKRGGEGSTGGEREQTINQLLVEMDGFEVNAGIVLMGATNRPDILDPALLRPGRFDRHVTLETPDLAGRLTILKLHAKDTPMHPDVDFELLARRTAGFTGADLANVINEGALLAIRRGGAAQVGMEQLLEAVLRVLHGPQRRGKLMSAEERSRLAYHEAGHAVVAAGLGQGSSIQRVSIVARAGKGLGSSVIGSEEERVLLTTTELSDRLAITMAGTAAEQLVYGDTSTTSEDDLAKANAMAREMVGIHGMSAEVGPLRLLNTDGGFLGSDIHLVDAVSGQTLAAFDLAVRALIDGAQAVAAQLLAGNRIYLDNMAEALEDQESLEGTGLESLLAGVSAGPSPPAGPTNGRRAAASAARTKAARP